jgi:UTP--glucose-1-phosphate uridylyltransferase
MHVLMPAVFEILEEHIKGSGGKKGVTLAGALSDLAEREQYLALEMHDRRYDIGVRYGLMTAQLALALTGQDHDMVLTRLLELLVGRELGQTSEV